MIPNKIYDYPVAAAIPTGPSCWVVVAEQGHKGRQDRFVVWSVEVIANGDLLPRNGRYDLPFGKALDVMAERAGYVPANV